MHRFGVLDYVVLVKIQLKDGCKDLANSELCMLLHSRIIGDKQIGEVIDTHE